MRALKRNRELPDRLDGSFESLLAQFSATTLELNPSLGALEFARRLTVRAAKMLGARAALLTLARGSDWEVAALSGPAYRWDSVSQLRLTLALVEQASMPSVRPRVVTARKALGEELTEALGWNDLMVAPLTGSEGELLGVLCLVDLGRELSETEGQLLDALVGHASVAFENVRLAFVLAEQHPPHVAILGDPAAFGEPKVHRDGTSSVYLKDPNHNNVEILALAPQTAPVAKA